jgi:hypothetical protein
MILRDFAMWLFADMAWGTHGSYRRGWPTLIYMYCFRSLATAGRARSDG